MKRSPGVTEDLVSGTFFESYMWHVKPPEDHMVLALDVLFITIIAGMQNNQHSGWFSKKNMTLAVWPSTFDIWPLNCKHTLIPANIMKWQNLLFYYYFHGHNTQSHSFSHMTRNHPDRSQRQILITYSLWTLTFGVMIHPVDMYYEPVFIFLFTLLSWPSQLWHVRCPQR